MSKVLVTGGAGFIGSFLVNALVDRGHQVTVIDNLSTSKTLSIARLQKAKEKIEFVNADIRNKEKVNELASGKEIIFHLAAQSDVEKSMLDPVYDAEVNIFGTLNVLRAAAENGVKKVVFFSSAAVYGDVKKLPIKEDTPANPISPYGFSKLAGETYCRLFSEIYNLETFAFRIFNVYGQGSAGVIYKFIDEIENNGKISLYGNGKQTRDFLSVHDVVGACLKVLDAKARGAEKFHLYNLANGKETALNEIIKALQQLSKKEFDITKAPERKGDIKRSVASSEKLKKELKYTPKVKLKEGIKELLDARG